MKAVVLCLAFAALSLAQTCPKQVGCPALPAYTGGVSPQGILPFYKYSYDISKSTPNNQLHLYIDVDDISVRVNQSLWLRVTSDATTARSANLNIHINVNQQSLSTDPNWFTGSLTSGSDSQTIKSPALNITQNGDRIWFDIYPTCSGCKSTVEFSVETAWLDDNSPFIWGSVNMIDNLRTIVFDKSQGGYVNFYGDFPANTSLWTSVVYPGTIDSSSSEIVLYWNKDTPATIANNVDFYPHDGAAKGDYLTCRPFVADTAGLWWLSTYVKTAADVTTDPKFTIKVGFNKVPCSDAVSTLASSLLLALIPLTMFFSQ